MPEGTGENVKTLYLDIETSPNLGDVWSLWNQNIGLSQLRESTRMMCFVAKWGDSSEAHFYSGDFDPAGNQRVMVKAAHELLSEADVVVHYNGKKFDVPHLNREFVEHGLSRPRPFHQVDLLTAVRKIVKLPSYKLQYVATWLGLQGKVQHEGHDLWVKCMAGDPKAWARMRTYNIQDVRLLPRIHHHKRLQSWLPNLPNVALIDGLEGDRCHCGSDRLIKQGFAYTKLGKFQQYQCKKCGSWTRGGRRLGAVDVREVAA